MKSRAPSIQHGLRSHMWCLLAETSPLVLADHPAQDPGAQVFGPITTLKAPNLRLTANFEPRRRDLGPIATKNQGAESARAICIPKLNIEPAQETEPSRLSRPEQLLAGQAASTTRR